MESWMISSVRDKEMCLVVKPRSKGDVEEVGGAANEFRIVSP
jgi:hypothetical protein